VRVGAGLVLGAAVALGAASQDLPADFRLFVIAAEDNRLRIPDGIRTPLLDQHRLRMTEDVRILLKLTRVRNPDAQRLAIRALGRYESREFIPDLVPLLAVAEVRDQAVEAIVQAFRGPAHPSDRGGQQVQAVMDTLNTHATRDDAYLLIAAESIAQLPYERADQAEAAQRMLREFLRRAEANTRLPLPGIVRPFEIFARRHRKLSPLQANVIERLRDIAVAANPRYQAASRWATAALVAAGAMDVQTLRSTAVDSREPEKRRLSAVVLGGATLEIDHPERVHFLKKLLDDEAVPVRIEAVRAWARRVTPVEGCELLLESLKDPNASVELTTMDALGEACPSDQNLTDRLTAEIKTPPVDRSWHRAAHALVALAKRAPDRASLALNAAYLSHPVWEVRMYGARVAAMLEDRTALERLALDAHHNVREATLPALRALAGSESDPYFVAALGQSDYQLLLTAANTLKGAKPTPELSGALMSALVRATAEKKETSRDTRLALIERLGELGTADQAEQLQPLVRDFDIQVALAALALYERWQGPSASLFGPVPLPRPPLPTHVELDEDLDAVVEMQSGAKFGIRLFAADAPLTVTRVKRLVRDRYYDGLTFHRVVPNFVVQGGSPGANEYAGDGPFMRDEIGRANAAFTVGLSTRGRDTGDAQFYINLIDNHRLDPDYTVFGRVCQIGASVDRAGRDAVEAIREGDRIASITLEKYDPCRN
jgi:cyclophilin family peptidyl-prolyl cis-trans isomerase/HEAT repeat protein